VSAKHKSSKCPCGRGTVVLRGVCNTCYQRVYRLVREGELTWGKAAKLGLVKPSRTKRGDRRHFKVSDLPRPYAQR